MKRIFSVSVENRSGVLSKIAGLFARRCYNIDSLVVGETEDHSVSRMTIVSSGDEQIMQQIEKQLNKKLDVIKVKTFEEQESVCKELMLMRVKFSPNNRKDIIETCSILGGKIVDMSMTYFLIQFCDSPEKIQLCIRMMLPFGISELARTGTVALTKCAD